MPIRCNWNHSNWLRLKIRPLCNFIHVPELLRNRRNGEVLPIPKPNAGCGEAGNRGEAAGQERSSG
jgi:hypothetical protein